MRTLPVLAISMLLGACGATRYTPNADRPFEPIPEFTSTNQVTLRNAEPSTEEVDTGHWLVDRNAWTKVAIEIAARELKQRGMTVVDGAPKVLDMAIVTCTTESGWVKITTQVVMRVKTGDGYEATYTGVNSSAMAANVRRQVDGAMMRVVVEMLKDPKIVAWLTH
ncbi:MAG TPA: hypothetical protein VFZ65_22225 [Planctomycetota bacterium]|nr:hypothetical protein [Planctomycetota bacterium]